MIKITAAIGDLVQKFKVDKEGKKHVSITLKLEVTEGHKSVPEIANLINKGVAINFEAIQPALPEK